MKRRSATVGPGTAAVSSVCVQRLRVQCGMKTTRNGPRKRRRRNAGGPRKLSSKKVSQWAASSLEGDYGQSFTCGIDLVLLAISEKVDIGKTPDSRFSSLEWLSSSLWAELYMSCITPTCNVNRLRNLTRLQFLCLASLTVKVWFRRVKSVWISQFFSCLSIIWLIVCSYTNKRRGGYTYLKLESCIRWDWLENTAFIDNTVFDTLEFGRHIRSSYMRVTCLNNINGQPKLNENS